MDGGCAAGFGFAYTDECALTTPNSARRRRRRNGQSSNQKGPPSISQIHSSARNKSSRSNPIRPPVASPPMPPPAQPARSPPPHDHAAQASPRRSASVRLIEPPRPFALLAGPHTLASSFLLFCPPSGPTAAAAAAKPLTCGGWDGCSNHCVSLNQPIDPALPFPNAPPRGRAGDGRFDDGVPRGTRSSLARDVTCRIPASGRRPASSQQPRRGPPIERRMHVPIGGVAMDEGGRGLRLVGGNWAGQTDEEPSSHNGRAFFGREASEREPSRPPTDPLSPAARSHL